MPGAHRAPHPPTRCWSRSWRPSRRYCGCCGRCARADRRRSRARRRSACRNHRTGVRRAWWDRGMSDLRIRPAGPEELDAVLAFWKTAAEGTSISDDREGVERLVARDPDALLLAERDGELVGTVIAGFDGWRCHLYRLAVHPDHRRRGIGTALLTAADERFVRLGGRRGDAMVLVRNERAQHAWRAAGYEPQEQWRRWVKHLTG
ncbi:GNAT family N-acetyltransferase [Streptomyces violaceorubidus]